MIDYSLKFYIMDDEYWFCFLLDNKKVRLHEDFPLWFSINKNHNLVHASNDYLNKDEFIVNYHDTANINTITSDHHPFHLSCQHIDSIYRKRKPYKLIRWDKSGYVRIVMHDDYYYEYEDNSIVRITSIDTGDSKVYEGDLIVAELNDDDTITEIFMDDKVKYSSWMSFDVYYRLKNIEVWEPFPIEHLNRDVNISVKNPVKDRFMIRTDKMLFKIKIDGTVLILDYYPLSNISTNPL